MFIGRDGQIGSLMVLWKKRVASFVTCRGRRRIGKSTLIEVFARRSEARFIKVEGIRPGANVSNADELASFAAQLSCQTGCEDTPPSSWMNAFARLDREIKDDGRTVVLLDEVSWMAHGDKLFASTLKIAWDNFLKRHDRLVLVVCGSVSTWIRENIIDDGAFYGRRSLDIVVPELSLPECACFWGESARRIDRLEIVDILSVTGGVPKYLEELDPSVGADENLRRLAFSPHGVLRDDFDEMFRDVITRQQTFAGAVIRSLVSGSKSIPEIARTLGLDRNGHFSAALDQLAEAGLVALDEGKNPATGEDAHGSSYRLRDNYARFYLKYVEPVAKAIDRGEFKMGSLEALDGWDAVKGLAFENLVVNNAPLLFEKLGLSNAQVVSAVPYRRMAARDGTRGGVQVDLLMQTRKSICLVEVKRQREIGREVIAEMEEKVRLVPRRSGVSVRTALVYEGHLAPIVEADGFFNSVIPFREILGL